MVEKIKRFILAMLNVAEPVFLKRFRDCPETFQFDEAE